MTPYSTTAIATIFGPILVIIGLWFILYKSEVRKLMETMKETPPMIYLVGVINLLIGLTIIQSHPSWRFDLSIFVTLLGWLFLLRGLIIFFMPKLVQKLLHMKVKSTLLFGMISIIWGVLLCFASLT